MKKSNPLPKHLQSPLNTSTFILYQPKILTFSYYNPLESTQTLNKTSFHHLPQTKKPSICQSQKIFENLKTNFSAKNVKSKITLTKKDISEVKAFKKKTKLIRTSRSIIQQSNISNNHPQRYPNSHKLQVTQKRQKKNNSNLFFSGTPKQTNQNIHLTQRSQSFFRNFSLELCNGCNDVIQDEDKLNYFQSINPQIVESKYIVGEKVQIEKEELKDFKKDKIEQTPSNLNEMSRSRHKIFQIKLNNRINKSLESKVRSYSNNRKGIFSPYKSKSICLYRSKSVRKKIFGERSMRVNQQASKMIASPIIYVKQVEQKMSEQEIPFQILEEWKRLQVINQQLISFKDSVFEQKQIQ